MPVSYSLCVCFQVFFPSEDPDGGRQLVRSDVQLDQEDHARCRPFQANGHRKIEGIAPRHSNCQESGQATESGTIWWHVHTATLRISIELKKTTVLKL